MAAIEKVLYIAAHGGFEGSNAPLGGGAAIFNLLSRQWTKRAPFKLETVTHAILGATAPSASDLVRFNESEYARFCLRFSQAATRRVLDEDPARVAVLVNDVSEGPDFARIAGAGFRVLTIYHVDVVTYIARIYLRKLVEPWRLTALWRGLSRLGIGNAAPGIVRLIFERQAASVEHSKKLIVPSHGMKNTLSRCYPDMPAARVEVIPWGSPEPDVTPAEASAEAARIRHEFGIPSDAATLVTLSRISPEKGQDLLLRALLEWEREGGPRRRLWLFICGQAAFMRGARHMELLRNLASKLKRIQVVFPGHVTGARKAGFLAMGDVYVFPSRHESYGLTLMEAMRAGMACIALDHDGSRESMPADCGVIVREGPQEAVVTGLRTAIEELIGDPKMRSRLAHAAAAHAAAQPFESAAARLAASMIAAD